MSEENATKKENDFLNKSVDFIFKNKTFTIIILILILGIILRYIAVVGVEPNADEMVHGSHAPGIIASGVIGRVWQSILWSYMTDLSSIIFGVSMFSSRFLSFLFGSLSIILVYLIGKELFNKRIGLISAFLLAVSSYHIKYTLIEMDIQVIFFILLAAFVFVRELKGNNRLSYVAAALLGIAALIKTLALFFVPVFIIGYWLHTKKVFEKKSIISVIKFGLIILLIFSPILIHNYLWYKDSQMVDAYLAQYFDVGKSREIYSSIQGINQGFKVGELIKGSWDMFLSYLKTDPMNLILGLAGLAFFIRRKSKYAIFFALFQIIPFFLLVYTNRLQTHFSIFPPIFAVYSAAMIDFFAEKYSSAKWSYNKILTISLLIIFFVSMCAIWPHISHKSAVGSMRSYVNNNIDENSIVIADSRIYRGRIAWMFLDTHYIESAYLSQLFQANEQLQGQPVQYQVYLVECVIDDCGWGTVDEQLNQSVESTLSGLKSNMQLQETIMGRREGTRDSPEPYFQVYSATTYLKPGALSIIDSTHGFFYYPERYNPKSQVLDNYKVSGMLDNLLFILAKSIIWASLIVSIICIFVPFYLLKKEDKN